MILCRMNKLIIKKKEVLLNSGASFRHKKMKTVLQFIRLSGGEVYVGIYSGADFGSVDEYSGCF